MAIITLEQMEFFAYHGCFEEEQIIGGKFLVDIEIQTNTAVAELSDKLSDTINYQRVYQLVSTEMAVKSKLIEHVARRIADSIKHEFPEITHLKVRISKMDPPIGGKMERVSFVLE